MRIHLLLLAGISTACLPEKSDGTACGAGTHEEDGLCVSDDEGDDTSEPDDGGTGSGGSGGSGGTDTGGSGGDSGGGSEGGDSGGSGGSSGGGDTGSSGSTSYTVCDDGIAPFLEIQDAIDDAIDGDTITVCEGIYGPVSLRARTLTIVGDSRDSTYIKGTSSEPALQVEGGVVSVSGFTFAGSLSSSYAAGAIDIIDGTVTFTDLLVTATSSPYVVSQWDGIATYERVDIIDNPGANTAVLVMIWDDASAEWSHSVFQGNTDVSMVLYSVGRLDFHNNLVYENTASTGLTFVSNSGASMEVTNNTFYDTQSSGWGTGGVVLRASGGTTLTGNIVANSDFQASSLGSSSFAVANYNDTFDTMSSGAMTGTGNIASDPQFTDPEGGDFTLTALSACTDAGDPASGSNDADGSRNDIGAYGGPGGSGW